MRVMLKWDDVITRFKPGVPPSDNHPYDVMPIAPPTGCGIRPVPLPIGR